MSVSRLAAIALLVMADCMPAYVSSTLSDAASLALVPETRSYIHVSGFVDGKECRTQLALTKGFLRQRTELRIPPGEEFTILANLADPVFNCSVAVSFVPKARESYAALINGTPEKCSMRIVRADGRTPEPSMRKRYWAQPTWSTDEVQCHEPEPAASKQQAPSRM